MLLWSFNTVIVLFFCFVFNPSAYRINGGYELSDCWSKSSFKATTLNTLTFTPIKLIIFSINVLFITLKRVSFLPNDFFSLDNWTSSLCLIFFFYQSICFNPLYGLLQMYCLYRNRGSVFYTTIKKKKKKKKKILSFYTDITHEEGCAIIWSKFGVYNIADAKRFSCPNK